jgi:hypothetical protein
MRWLLSVALALALATPSLAADLSLTPRKRTVHVRHHHRVMVRVVRDYDGTPIAIHRRPDGTADARFAWRASPSRYLNGERVASWIRR